MKKLIAVLSSTVVLVLTGATAPPPQAPSFMIVGQVTDAVTGEPLDNVRVVNRADRLFSETDDEGAFRLEVPPGVEPLEVTLIHPCYHRVRVEVARDPAVDARRVDVGLPFDHERYEGVARPLGGCRQGASGGP